MQRFFLIVVIGYILGIIWGQYISISIVLLYIFIAILFFLKSSIFYHKSQFKIFSFNRYWRYIKIFLNLNIIIIICFVSFFSYNVIIQKNMKREKMQNILKESKNLELTGEIVSGKVDKEYKVRYELKMDLKALKNNKIYIEIDKKNLKEEINYGDIVLIKGEFIEPDIQRNYCGFDYNEYLKTKDILGTIKVDNITIKTTSNNLKINLYKYIQNLKNKIKGILPENISALFIGIVLGDRTYIDEQTTENFKNSNLSHILAVSGMHITFLILNFLKIFKNILGRRKTYFFSIFVIILYVLITGFSASILRSALMGIIMLISKIIYRKNDIWNAISFSLLLILIYNPYYLFDIGLQLSYGGTIGILLFQKVISDYLKYRIYKIKKIRKIATKKISYFINKILEIISVTLSAQIIILPIMIYNFHTFSVYFLLSNLFASVIIEALFFISIIFLFLVIVSVPLALYFSGIVEIFYLILIWISYFGMLPYSQILINRPYGIIVFLYFCFLALFIIFQKIKNNKMRIITYRRFKNLKSWIIYKIKLKKKILCICVLISILFSKYSYLVIKSNLDIHFIDVGQGDATLIVTSYNKKILVDGGGSEFSNFDVGEQILIPYLLNRRIKKLDFVFISHFDSDHVGGILSILEKINVQKIIIPKQFEFSENYRKFINIIMKRKINVQVVLSGDRLKIENNLYFDILYPKEEQIVENVLNNNSMVMKLNFGNFSMLFTGDIEKIAERDMINNLNSNILKSDVLKIAHHGSKTSTTDEFIRKVLPDIALIGVGKNNSFGHPSSEVIERLEKLNVKVYRTDQKGEIKIEASQNGKYFIDVHIK